jgi:hypothetical protein
LEIIPIARKPISIIAQVEGSGMPGATIEKPSGKSAVKLIEYGSSKKDTLKVVLSSCRERSTAELIVKTFEDA